MPEEMMAVVPLLKLRKITYDLEKEWAPPKVDDFLVTVGKGNKPGSVYLIASVRLVNPTKPRDFNRWSMEVISCPELVEHTTIRPHEEGLMVMVKEKAAYPIAWYPRNKKKK